MKRAFLMAVQAAVCGVACAQEDTNLYCRVYFANPSDCVEFVDPPAKEGWYKGYLTNVCGVEWPEGARVFDPIGRSSRLVVLNTANNIEKCDAYFDHEMARRRVAWEYQVFAFRLSDVESLLNGEGVSVDTLMTLRKKKRAKLVSTARCMGDSGQETTTQEIVAIHYPSGAGGLAVTNDVDSGQSSSPFENQVAEIGTRLQIVPEFSADVRDVKTIHLMLKYTQTSLERWESYEAVTGQGETSRKVKVRLPVVRTSSIENTFKIPLDETILAGGCKAQDDDWVNYHFLKAWVDWTEPMK